MPEHLFFSLNTSKKVKGPRHQIRIDVRFTKGGEMKHEHEFERISHPGLTQTGADLGIRGAQVRRCLTCRKELTFILTKKGWFPLFEENESNKEYILLA